jgi:hypothetical protein
LVGVRTQEESANGPAGKVQRVRDAAEHEASRDVDVLGKARPRVARDANAEATGGAGGAACTTSRRGLRRLENVSRQPYSNAKISKILNRSAQSGE